MEFYTLNQVINNLRTICAAHGQVSQFRFGSDVDISASEQQLYPLVWVDVTTSQIGYKLLSLNLIIMVMDIQKADQTNEQDTLSDTLSIAQDIFAALNNSTYQDYFTVNENASLEPIREGLPDLVNGWKMNLNLELEQLNNRCQIPT